MTEHEGFGGDPEEMFAQASQRLQEAMAHRQEHIDQARMAQELAGSQLMRLLRSDRDTLEALHTLLCMIAQEGLEPHEAVRRSAYYDGLVMGVLHVRYHEPELEQELERQAAALQDSETCEREEDGGPTEQWHPDYKEDADNE